MKKMFGLLCLFTVFWVHSFSQQVETWSAIHLKATKDLKLRTVTISSISTDTSLSANTATSSIPTVDAVKKFIIGRRKAVQTLTYAASVALDFSDSTLKTLSITGNITFTTVNLAAGEEITLRVVGDGSSRNYTFPGTWVFVGGTAPTALAANKTAILVLRCFGGTDATVVAFYSVQS